MFEADRKNDILEDLLKTWTRSEANSARVFSSQGFYLPFLPKDEEDPFYKTL